MVSFEAKWKVNTLGVTRVIHREISGLGKEEEEKEKTGRYGEKECAEGSSSVGQTGSRKRRGEYDL